MPTLDDKDRRRRNFVAKKMYEDRQFKQRVQDTKPIKAKTRRLKKQEILRYAKDDQDVLYDG